MSVDVLNVHHAEAGLEPGRQEFARQLERAAAAGVAADLLEFHVRERFPLRHGVGRRCSEQMARARSVADQQATRTEAALPGAVRCQLEGPARPGAPAHLEVVVLDQGLKQLAHLLAQFLVKPLAQQHVRAGQARLGLFVVGLVGFGWGLGRWVWVGAGLC